MAAVIIPGLTVALGQTDLVETNRLYNTLAEVDDQPDVCSEHLNALAQIFVKYGMHETFGVHLVHAHSRIEEDKVMLGTNITLFGANIASPTLGYWTKPAKMNEIKLSEVHGRIFKVLDSTRFVAYEFTEGPITDMSSCPVEFFKEVTNFLLEKGLADILALEVRGNCAEDMVELDLTELGTIMLKDALATRGPVTHVTGWVFSHEENGIVSYKGGQSHAPTTKGPHKVFIDGKLGLDIDRLHAVLTEHGVI